MTSKVTALKCISSLSYVLRVGFVMSPIQDRIEWQCHKALQKSLVRMQIIMLLHALVAKGHFLMQLQDFSESKYNGTSSGPNYGTI